MGSGPIDLAHDAVAPARAGSAAFIAAGVVWGLLFLLRQCLPEEPGEPLTLRWLRTASEHPLRSSLAGVLIVFGLSERSAHSKVRPVTQGPGKKL